MVYIQFDQKI